MPTVSKLVLVAPGLDEPNGVLTIGESASSIVLGSPLSTTGSLTVGTTLTVNGAAQLNSTLGVTAATTLSSTLDVTGAANFNSTANVRQVLTTGIDVGAGAFSIKPGTNDHCYAQWFARTATPNARSAWVGFGSVGTTTFTLSNEAGGGMLTLLSTGLTSNVPLVLSGTGTVSATATDGGLTLKGNRAAASTTADVIATSTATRTAGNLLDVQNNGASAVRIDFIGNLIVGRNSTNTFPFIITDAANATLLIEGNRNAADGNADLVFQSQKTRTAGALVSYQNNGVVKQSVTFEGATDYAGAVSPAASAAGYVGKQTKKNLIVAWAHLTLGASPTVTVSAGFNVSSASWTTQTLTVTFATTPASNDAVILTIGNVNGAFDATHFQAIALTGIGSSTINIGVADAAGVAQNWVANATLDILVVGT